MKCSLEQFRQWRHKKVTLLGMSGVGKTRLSGLLRGSNWFHYSGDYRIGSRYLDESILDMVKAHAMREPLLRDLLRKDWISIKNNIQINDLGPVLAYVGKLGNPELGGVELVDFQRRQEAYRQAEIRAMEDVPAFIDKAQQVYGYQHFVNDVGGSLCELEHCGIVELLAQHTLILYIQVTNSEDERRLIERAQSDPKPLYYRPDFLNTHLEKYLQQQGLDYAAQMDPNDFTRWIFPYLFRSRIPRYQEIAKQGYCVTAEEVATVGDEQDFIQLLELAIQRQ